MTPVRVTTPAPRARRAVALALAIVACSGGCATTQPGPATPEVTRLREEALDLEVELRQIAATQDAVTLRGRLASLYLTLVDYPGAPTSERRDNAQRALAHAHAAIALDDDRVEGHFYRAVAVGRILELSTIPDLGQIDELNEAGKRARELDPGFQGAGPLRLLAMLYWQAPAWPVGPEEAGEDELIEALFREAIELAPTCAENRISFAEYLADERRDPEAQEQARAARDLLPADPLVSAFDRPALQARVDALLKKSG